MHISPVYRIPHFFSFSYFGFWLYCFSSYKSSTLPSIHPIHTHTYIHTFYNPPPHPHPPLFGQKLHWALDFPPSAICIHPPKKLSNPPPPPPPYIAIVVVVVLLSSCASYSTFLDKVFRLLYPHPSPPPHYAERKNCATHSDLPCNLFPSSCASISFILHF